MTPTSTLYVRCPGCGDTTLIQHVRDTYVCAACAYDYGVLAEDPAAFEAFLVARLREGPAQQLAAIGLHQWLSGLSTPDSAAAIRAMAERHGVALPPPMDPNALLRWVLVGVALLVVAIVGFNLYVVLGG